MTAPLFESSITSLPLLSKGKVRDIYAVDADKLLIGCSTERGLIRGPFFLRSMYAKS